MYLKIEAYGNRIYHLKLRACQRTAWYADILQTKRRKENAEADGAELENTDKVIAIQSEQITRLDGRVEKLEEKVDKLEIIIEEKDVQLECDRIIIRQAYKCPTPPEQCPVLLKRAEMDNLRKRKHQPKP